PRSPCTPLLHWESAQRWQKREPSAGGRAAAVGMEHLAGHVARILAGQEKEAGGDLVRLTGPTHRRVLAEFGDILLRLPAGWIERGPDWSRRDAIHPDSILDQILRKRAGESDDRPLGRGIVEQTRRPFVGGFRGAVDDRRAFLEMRPGRLGHEEHAEDVRLERPAELVLVDLRDVLVGVLLA